MKWLEPMEPVLSNDIMEGGEWIHQIKWDGIRGLCYIENKAIKLYTKSGRSRTGFYPEINGLVDIFKGNSCVLDGELIVFDGSMRPTFQLVQYRDRVNDLGKVKYYSKKYPVCYIIFDILCLDNKDFRSVVLEDRLGVLNSVVGKSCNIMVTEDYKDGRLLYDMMKARNYEGIVSKRKGSCYIAGKKHSDWIKTKFRKKILTIVCGVKIKNGYPNSLVLGIFREGKIEYIGNASIGLKNKDFILINDYLVDLKVDNPSINGLGKVTDIIWFKPMMTCWIGYAERTLQGGLRQPRILGFSNEDISKANGKEYVE